MVLAVCKQLQITNINVLDNFNHYNFLRKSISALGLDHDVFSAGLGLNSPPGCPEIPSNDQRSIDSSLCGKISTDYTNLCGKN